MKDKEFVFSRIGMALISAQRVEFICGELVQHLSEFDKDIYGITGEEFLSSSGKAVKARMTLGRVFRLLKLNPKLVIEEELNEYLVKRNTLVHGFWRNYFQSISAEQINTAIEYCYDFSNQSERIESFFKGFLYFLALRHVEDRTKMDNSLQKSEGDFDHFITSLNSKKLQDN